MGREPDSLLTENEKITRSLEGKKSSPEPTPFLVVSSHRQIRAGVQTVVPNSKTQAFAPPCLMCNNGGMYVYTIDLESNVNALLDHR